MANPLFLYVDPFIERSNPSTKEEYLLDYFSETERLDQEKIFNLVLNFAIDNEIVVNQEGELTSVPENKTSSWVWAITWTNFRGLVNNDNYLILLEVLQSNSGLPVNAIIDFHTRLGMLFDSRFLNTLVNRTMTSVGMVPYPVPEDKVRISWEDIHKATPFVWLVIFIQAVLRSSVKPVK